MLLAILPVPSAATAIEEAVRKGLAINPEIRAGLSEEAAGETDIEIAQSGYYPSLSVSGGPRSVGFEGMSYDVTAAQMLYDWGKVASTVDSAKAAQRQISERLRQKREEVALDIVETYLNILVTERQMEGLEAHIADLDEIRQMTVARSEGRYADRSEMERASLELARAREQLAIERSTLENARNEYRLLVGEEARRLADPAPASVAAYVARHDFTALIKGSPSYRIAMEDRRSAEAKLKEARSSLLPQLNLEGSMTRRDIGGVPHDDSVVALRFRMSNLQGFSSILRSRGARQRLETAIFNERSIAQDLRRELQTLFDNAAMLREREQSLDAQVKASAALGETYFEQFRVGQRDVIDLLNTRREHFEANRQLVSTRIDRLRVEYQAAARLGLIGALLEKELY